MLLFSSHLGFERADVCPMKGTVQKPALGRLSREQNEQKGVLVPSMVTSCFWRNESLAVV